MTIKFTNNAEGGTDGTAVTVANSGGTSGTAFKSVTVDGTGSTLTYSSNQSHLGSLAYSLNVPTSGHASLTVPDSTSYASGRLRYYLFLNSFPSAGIQHVQVIDQVNNLWYLDMTSAGKLQFVNAVSSVVWTSTNALPTGTWIRVEVSTVAGTSSTNGSFQVSWFLGENTTPVETYSATNVNTGTNGGIKNWNIGKVSTAASFSGYIDDIWVDDGAFGTYVGTSSGPLTVSGTGTTAFSASLVGEKGVASLTGSGQTAFAPSSTTVTVAKTFTGAGTLFIGGGVLAPGSIRVSGVGTLGYNLVGITSIAQVWNGGQWRSAPVFRWNGTGWDLGKVSVIHTLPTPVHGMYGGPGLSAVVDAYMASSGNTVSISQDMADHTSWQTLMSVSALSAWNTWCGGSSERRLVYSVGLLTTTDDADLTVNQRYANLCAGLYDSYFLALGGIFSSFPNLRDATIRLGARMNDAGRPWSLPPGDPDTINLYKYAYNRIAAIMKQACEGLTFEWCPIMGPGTSQRSIADLYPGDGYVDYVGLVINDYDGYKADTPPNRFNWIQTTQNGLNDQLALCAARGKRPVLSSWGLVPARTNWATDPRATGLYSTGATSGIGFYADRYLTNTNYGSIANATDGPNGTGITTYARGTVSAAGQSGLGFHISGNPETTTPSTNYPYLNVAAGSTITVSHWIRTSRAGVTWQISARFAANSGASTWGSATTSSASVALTAGQWSRISFTIPVPAGMTSCALLTRAATATWQVADTFDATGLLIEETGTLTNYFDGVTTGTLTDAYGWIGTPNNSPSYDTTVGQNGGGDDPTFIADVISWMAANQYVYSIYNNTNTVNGIDSRLSSYPLAAAMYNTLWSAPMNSPVLMTSPTLTTSPTLLTKG